MTSTLRRSLGTYKKTGELLDIAIRQAACDAAAAGLYLVDTATKYGNQAEVAAILKDYPHMRVGSKVNRPGHVSEDLAEMEALFGPSLQRVLLHRPMSLANWRVLEEAKKQGRVREIGVSNYSVELLEELLANCEVAPDVIQNELHPCIATPMLGLCRKHGIRFEAHTVMAANEFLAPIAGRLGVTAAQVAIAYCLAQGADVCFSTVNLQHLRQDMSPDLETLLSASDVAELQQMAFKHPIRIYRSQGSLASDVNMVHAQMMHDIAAYEKGEPYSDLCISLPKTHRGTGSEVTKQLAAIMFPEDAAPSSWQRLDALLHKMRKVLEKRDDELRAARRAAAGPKVCALPREMVAFPDALPVDIPEPGGFTPFLEELTSLSTPCRAGIGIQYPRRFEKGTLFPDGRMDLCKQVIQPCFVELCQAVASTTSIKHFLLGNNVVFRDGTEDEKAKRLEALVSLIRTNPEISTWYLAGNGIDATLSAPLAEAFRGASHMNALWLKMNPVKTGARCFGELATAHQGLELLDLFNTGLGDDGVRALREGLSPKGSEAMKHLYLSINDITDGQAVADIVRLLPNLESLFLGVNLFGDSGAEPVLAALAGHRKLLRLEIGACGLTDASLPGLQQIIATTPVQALKLGSYKSTEYFAGRHNAFKDAAVLVGMAKHLRYLNLDGCIEGCDMALLEEGLRRDAPSTTVYAAQGPVGNKRVLRLDGCSSPEEMAQIVHPHPFVDNIQSVYRNNM